MSQPVISQDGKAALVRALLQQTARTTSIPLLVKEKEPCHAPGMKSGLQNQQELEFEPEADTRQHDTDGQPPNAVASRSMYASAETTAPARAADNLSSYAAPGALQEPPIMIEQLPRGAPTLQDENPNFILLRQLLLQEQLWRERTVLASRGLVGGVAGGGHIHHSVAQRLLDLALGGRNPSQTNPRATSTTGMLFEEASTPTSSSRYDIQPATPSQDYHTALAQEYQRLVLSHFVDELKKKRGSEDGKNRRYDALHLPPTTPAREQQEEPSASSRTTPSSTKDHVRERFPQTLFRMLQETRDRGRDDIISFTASGAGFAIHEPRSFELDILPHYFGHGNVRSFKRQLNLYGFRLLGQGVDAGAYAHAVFHRDNRQASEQIKREK
uniref:HSF-type DNA-binding domain-containing protein n=1 Tax=Entomoneis paludosa TaxID=265537 RepID=A0A7S2YEY8_9STRA|mmetsp:Transcript_29796/g.62252  ORF Transcript_29796/g.62252 Transcript_29796/m.62252 type:complete len:385 (+) Transcript_29796:475-1629(+)